MTVPLRPIFRRHLQSDVNHAAPPYAAASPWHWTNALKRQIGPALTAAGFGVAISLPAHASLQRTLLLTLTAALLSTVLHFTLLLRAHLIAEQQRKQGVRETLDRNGTHPDFQNDPDHWSLDRKRCTATATQHPQRYYPLRARNGKLQVLVLDTRPGREGRPLWTPLAHLLSRPERPGDPPAPPRTLH